MNDANYIIKNIAMLKNNTINVKNLTNKFCLELSRNFGIERTLELENTISELLAKYKSGEIGDDAVVESFGGILNISSTENSNITSNYNKNNNGNIKQQTTKDTIADNLVSEDISVSPNNENVEDISNDVNNPSNLENVDTKEEEDDVEILDDTNELEDEKIVEEEKKEIINNEDVSSDIEEIKEELSNISSIDSTIFNEENLNDSEVVNDIKETDNTKQEVATVNVVDKDSVDEKVLNPIVDIEPSNLADVVSICEGISGELSSVKITPPAKALPYADGIVSAAAEITGVSSSLSGFKSIVLSTITGAEENDVSYDANEFSWSDIIKIYDKNKNSQAVEVDIEFFKDKCDIVDDRYAILNIDGRECKYDTKQHKFYVDGKVVFDAAVYVPSGNNDYSKLNTYTYFMGSGYNKHITDGKDGQGGKGQDTNAVLIQITKKDPWNAYGETALMTKFINEAAGTDLKDNHCRNIVGGDSVYGTHALKTAAQSGDLYQTVYCIDNAVIATGYNNHGGDKTQMTEDEVRALDGKDVYFISVAGDPNLNHGKTHPSFTSKGGSYQEGYTYTGLVHLLDVCPNVKAYMVYPENASGAHNSQMEIYRELEKQYPEQYKYIPEAWNDFANFDYQNHTQGNFIPAEASKSSVTNYNYYYSR